MTAQSRTARSRHISVWIDRSADDVYDFAGEPTNLPIWASGLAGSVEKIDGKWTADSPIGRIQFIFVPRNDHRVLDHDITLPSGETVHNPMRVIPDGHGCEVVFTLRRRPGMSEADFTRDADTVTADLATLKRVLEAR